MVLALALPALSCLAPTLSQIELRTTGTGGGLVEVTRSVYDCDGSGSTDPCELASKCGGGGDRYLCGMGYLPDHPVRLTATASPGSTFQGWVVTVTPPSAAPTTLPLDPSPTKDVTQTSAATLNVQVRFASLDAGAD